MLGAGETTGHGPDDDGPRNPQGDKARPEDLEAAEDVEKGADDVKEIAKPVEGAKLRHGRSSRKTVWSRDSKRSLGPDAGARVSLAEAHKNQPHALRHVRNLHDLRENITGLQQTGRNEIVFYPGEFDGELVWHTRHHRKNRFPMVEAHSDDTYVQRTTLNLVNVELDNVSWWIAHVFTWGSILWVVNGVYLLWPVESEKENLVITAVSAFFGGFVFEFGAYFAVLEAINPRRHLEFGYRLAHAGKSPMYEKSKQMLHLVPHVENEKRDWRWFALEFSDTGKRAASVQFIGATFFLAAVTMALPNAAATDLLIPSSRFVVQDIFIWGFQVVGSLCFFYAGVVLMNETQYAWYMPNLGSLGWHANFWNTIGALGFFFCAVFGFLDNVDGRTVCCQTYGTVVSTFWGSIGFLIGSLLMVIEVANKHPYPTPKFLQAFTRPTSQLRAREEAKKKREAAADDDYPTKHSSGSASASSTQGPGSLFRPESAPI